MATWSIALSGGGHRASLFGLGALLYCADAGVNTDVTSMASVSGGSLTNGYVGAQLDYAATNGPALEQAMKPLVRRCAVTGTVQWAWESVLLLVSIVAGVALAVVAWFLPVDRWFEIVLFAVGLVSALTLTQLRSWVADRILRRLLFTKPGGGGMALADLNPTVTHVMCATEVQSKVHAYFARNFVYDFEYGVSTSAGPLPLSTAVQASACLPGAFSPRLLSARKLGITKKNRRWMWLVDGGVYDNMGEQWAQGFATRSRDDARLATQIGDPPDNLLVVNSSGRGYWTGATPLMRLPVFGEILTLLREKSILYQVGTTTRRSTMIVQFDQVRYLRSQPPTRERDEKLVQLGPSGTLVHIATSPAWVKKPPATLSPDQRAACARVAANVDAFGDEAWVKGLGEQSSGVKTTLAKIGRDDSIALLWHGYVLTMANLHVFFNAPLFDLPAKERFASLMS